MRIIDLLNKIANGEKVPKKIKAQNYIWKYEESFSEYKNDKFQELLKFLFGYYNNGGCSLTLFGALDYEVEILEDTTEEIEELDTTTENTLFTMECYTGIPEKAQDWNFNILKNKIIEITRTVNKLNKQDTYKAENCMTD